MRLCFSSIFAAYRATTCLFSSLSLLFVLTATEFSLPGLASTNSSPAPALMKTERQLSQMFSDSIRTTLNACLQEGGVDLGVGEDQDGSVICKKGDRTSSVVFKDYLITLADFLTAGFLVGLRSAIQENPQLSPETLKTAFGSPEGQKLLKELLTTALSKNPFLTQASTQSLDVLVTQVLERTQPALENPDSLGTLLGTREQYAQVVNKFCLYPGLSVSQAQSEVPGMNSIQLYAICIQESGLAEAVLQKSK
jgi:hypothetical protein